MNPPPPEFWTEVISPRLAQLARLTDAVAVAVIVCRRGTTPATTNYKGHSIETRYYSDEETEEFLSALRSIGLTVFPFYREDDFIRWVLDGRGDIGSRRLLAYSSGASVPGVGAKALLPAFCLLHGIDVIGPDPHVASLARHKFHALALLQSSGVPVPPTYLFVPGTGWLDGRRPRPGTNVIVKPSHEAASIGVDALSLLTSDQHLDAAVADRAQIFQQPMTVQEFVRGREIEVPVFVFGRCHTPLAVGLTMAGQEDLGARFLDYETVATDNYGFYRYAAYGPDVPLFSHAARAAAVLGIRDFGRIDFRIDETGLPWAIDVSTSPYICRHSSFAFAANACGGESDQLPLALLAACCERVGLLVS